MSEKFDNFTKMISDKIRKPMPPASKTILSDKEKAKRKDMKKGRQNWRYTESKQS